MNREYAMQWVEALRSGRYQQGKGALNENGKFCCLGVVSTAISTTYSQKQESIHKKGSAQTDPFILAIEACSLIFIDSATFLPLQQLNASALRSVGFYLREW